ncbi:N-acetylmuramoyl-L-alanine amidase [Mobilicoccus massiliensis]|uniref:N-acetylmuramoyl-L-alanine amidase n=1 Tax=Mobilicoccus massiliensis TaxID=1522310 RepID=UPI00058F4C0C|nr:N-acetylmuramoyl-L-alanine amidase [Mobilicoccus massiliensis]
MPRSARVLGATALAAALTSALTAFPPPADANAPAATRPTSVAQTPVARRTPPTASVHTTRHLTVARGPHAVPSTGGLRLAPLARGPLTGRTIVVDPGHNGRRSRVNDRLVPAGGGRTKPCNTSGTASRSGASEHAFTWNLANRTATELRRRGATVVLTRPNDRGVGPCVDERAAIGNRARADLVLSIHADGNTSRRARGFHIITSTRMTGGPAAQRASTRYAMRVRTAFARTGMPRSTYLGRGTALTPRTDIAGLNLSRRPAIMLEAGNMRHPTDAALLAKPSFRAKAARLLADATQQTLRR